MRKKRRYRFSTKSPKKILVSEGFCNRRVRLTQLRADQPHKILGIKIAPNGSQKEQVKAMKEKVEGWCKKIGQARVQPALTRLSYKMTLWPGLKYPMGVSQFSER